MVLNSSPRDGGDAIPCVRGHQRTIAKHSTNRWSRHEQEDGVSTFKIMLLSKLFTVLSESFERCTVTWWIEDFLFFEIRFEHPTAAPLATYIRGCMGCCEAVVELQPDFQRLGSSCVGVHTFLFRFAPSSE